MQCSIIIVYISSQDIIDFYYVLYVLLLLIQIHEDLSLYILFLINTFDIFWFHITPTHSFHHMSLTHCCFAQYHHMLLTHFFFCTASSYVTNSILAQYHHMLLTHSFFAQYHYMSLTHVHNTQLYRHTIISLIILRSKTKFLCHSVCSSNLIVDWRAQCHRIAHLIFQAGNITPFYWSRFLIFVDSSFLRLNTNGIIWSKKIFAS